VVDRINRDLVRLAAEFRPELLFVYRGTHVTAATLRRIRSLVPGVAIAGYNNDDPFGPGQPRYRWRHFLDCLPECDVTLAYRHHNLEEFTRHGARRVRLLRSWFGRVELLEAVVRQGWRLRLFGPGAYWNSVLARSAELRHLLPVRQVWGEEYNKALCGAKVALCFFSRLNRDTYTRRCFEIPATGTMMLSEYSDDLASLFTEGREADYFRSREELLAKLALYIGDDARRHSVAAAGMARVNAAGHDIRSRLRELLDWMTTSGLLGGHSHA